MKKRNFIEDIVSTLDAHGRPIGPSFPMGAHLLDKCYHDERSPENKLILRICRECEVLTHFKSPQIDAKEKLPLIVHAMRKTKMPDDICKVTRAIFHDIMNKYDGLARGNTSQSAPKKK